MSVNDTPRHPLYPRAQDAPENPGVYEFQDARGRVIYVGKAKNLRKRVLSYFSKDHETKTRAMVAKARRLEFVVTATEVEALILENRLIKQHRPRYNINLRDDKTYPYVKVTTGETWPRAFLTRRVHDDGHSYFGPFMGHHMASRVMELIRTHTQVRTCSITIDGTLPRPCLYYDMGACLGPCVAGLTTAGEYAEAVDDVVMLLQGRHDELKPRLETQMWRASEAADFERAARYRDLIKAVDELARGQHVEVPGSGAVDVIAVHGDGRDATAVVLVYREGRLMDKREFHWEGLDAAVDAGFLSAFVGQYYDANPAVPELIELPLSPEDGETLREFLRTKRGEAVRLAIPRRGTRARVLELARENAKEAFRLRFRQPRKEADRLAGLLAVRLGLPQPVRRLECFDISHTRGEAQVASLVVWEAGKMRKAEYRSFNVRTGADADDPAAVAEAVARRYRRRLAESAALPELVVVDGGSAQVAAASLALVEVGAALPVVGLAKRHEDIYLPGERDALHLEPNDPVRLLLQQVRDEAHRFAVTRHRQRRSKRRLATELLAIPGVGPARAKKLLVHFGSLDEVRRRQEAELAGVVGGSVAGRVWRALHPDGARSGSR